MKEFATLYLDFSKYPTGSCQVQAELDFSKNKIRVLENLEDPES